MSENETNAARKVSAADQIAKIDAEFLKTGIPEFRSGDTIKVHAKIIEGNKERIQVFEGLVIARQGHNLPSATFTVRKVSYNIGVERTFPLHSPRIEKIEVLSRGKVRRKRLYYLRDLRGKKGKVQSTAVAMETTPAAAAQETVQ